MNHPQFSRHCAGLLAAVVTLVAASSLRAEIRSIQSFDNDWRFNKGDATGAEAAAFSDAAWTKLNVPHDWSIEGPFAANASPPQCLSESNVAGKNGEAAAANRPRKFC